MRKVADSIFYVDNFYDDIADVRKSALSDYPYELTDFKHYTLNQSPPLRDDYSKFLIEQKTGDFLTSKGITAVNSYFRKNFNTSHKNNLAIHADFYEDLDKLDYWIMIVPLNNVSGSESTKFWSHNKSKTKSLQEEMAFIAKEKKSHDVLDQKGFDFENWTNYFTDSYVQNRAIIFNSQLWHSAPEGFGNTDDDCRFIQLTMIKVHKQKT